MKLLQEDRRLLWCHNPKPIYEKDEDEWDQYYIAARTIAVLRPGIDKIILPGNAQLREFFDFCRQTLGYHEDQALWTSGKSYLMDKDIKEELLGDLKELIKNDQWKIVPYSVTDVFNEWAQQLNIPVFGDEEKWVTKYSDKTILHPSINEPRSGALLPQHVKGVTIPRGYSCSSVAELHAAFLRLREEGVAGSYMLKPSLGSTGIGIIEIEHERQLAEYNFNLGRVVLEEKIDVDTDAQGNILAPSVQYVAGELFNGVTDQIIQGVIFAGNIFPSKISVVVQQQILNTAQAVLQWLKPKGPGGLDFLVSKGQPYLIDPNIGRFTGAHPARLFQSMYAPGTHFVSWKINPKKPVVEFWRDLQQKQVAFRAGKNASGVFPLCYLQDMWGMLVAFSDSAAGAQKLKQVAESCL